MLSATKFSIFRQRCRTAHLLFHLAMCLDQNQRFLGYGGEKKRWLQMQFDYLHIRRDLFEDYRDTNDFKRT